MHLHCNTGTHLNLVFEVQVRESLVVFIAVGIIKVEGLFLPVIRRLIVGVDRLGK